jgi:hypothetical protein
MREGEEEGAAWGVWGAGGAQAGLSWVTSRIEPHDTHDH